MFTANSNMSMWTVGGAPVALIIRPITPLHTAAPAAAIRIVRRPPQRSASGPERRDRYFKIADSAQIQTRVGSPAFPRRLKISMLNLTRN